MALQSMSNAAFVVFEKNSGEFSYKQAAGYPPAMDECEAKIVAACKQLKTISPKKRKTQKAKVVKNSTEVMFDPDETCLLIHEETIPLPLAGLRVAA